MEIYENLSQDVSGIVLEDYKDRKIPIRNYEGRVLILIGGGRGAADDAVKIGYAVQDAYREREGVEYAAIALLRKLPRFIPRSAVKAYIDDDPEITPFLDWKGRAERAFGFVNDDLAHIFVIDQEGILRLKIAGPHSDALMERVHEQVKELLGG